MNELQTLQALVKLDRETILTDSLIVAREFRKPHKTVLRAYDNLRCSAKFGRHNFVPTFYRDAQGKLCRLVKMTKDGFLMLAMSFTGPAAVRFKEAFIAAFNALADYVQRHQQTLWQQMQALELKDSDSKVRASFGSRLMSDRKRALPGMRKAQAELAAQMQMSLFPQDKEATA